MGQQPKYGGVTVARETFEKLERLESELRSSKAEIVAALTEAYEKLPPAVQAAFLLRGAEPWVEVAKYVMTERPDVADKSLTEYILAAQKAIKRAEVAATKYETLLDKPKKG